MKYFISLIALTITIGTAHAQEATDDNFIKNKITIGLGSTLNNSRYIEGDLNNSLYKELTIDYGIGRFISAGVYIGHQERTSRFSYLPSTHMPSIADSYTQTFIPVGLRLSFLLTPFVIENLNIKVDPNKFDFYLTYLAGAAFNSVQHQFTATPSPNNRIDYSKYHTNEDINYQAGILTGIRYKPTKNFGIFLEGGLGSIGNINLGIFARF